ncbi:MAG: hypothetical protein KAR47_20745 [Planctomycetes bacterium]|nr:hypothetical protein [Planctomycetota bacterium]
MANSVIEIPFYAAAVGEPLTGAAAEMDFESLMTLGGTDKSGSAPAISEIGGGWYKFSAVYGTAPFDAGDLIGVIDADKSGNNSLASAERYIPVEVRLDFYAFRRLTEKAIEIDSMGCLESDLNNSIKADSVKLSADGWDALTITEPAGDPDGWTVAQKLMWLIMRFLNKHTSDNYDGIKVHKADGTAATTQAVTEANGVKTVAKAQ